MNNINKRIFVRAHPLFLFLLIALILKGCGNPETKSSAAPNIILILADDMGYGDPGSYNSQSKISTPHIDQLAAQGMRFTDAHAAGTWCVPSRYGLLTGRYPMRTSLNWRETNVIDSSRTTLASLLKEAGYQTGMIGKWHQGFANIEELRKSGYRSTMQGGPTDHGFDYYYGIPASLDIPPYYYIKNNQVEVAPTDSIRASHTEQATSPVQGAFWRAGKAAPGFRHSKVLPRFSEKALLFLDRTQQDDKERPFFLYVALASPHTPWLPSEPFNGASEAGMYGDFVMQTDDAIGQILEKVEELGVKDNTLILFTSDNGPVWFKPDIKRFDHQSTADLRGMKSDSWEGGHRVPFLARWPGKIKPGNTSSALIGFTDLLATFAGITGHELADEEGKDSINMLPVLLGEKQSMRSALLIEDRAVRKGPWKLIFGYGMGGVHRNYMPGETDIPANPKGELYNLRNDRSEQHNVYNEYPKKVKELKMLYEQVKKDKDVESKKP